MKLLSDIFCIKCNQLFQVDIALIDDLISCPYCHAVFTLEKYKLLMPSVLVRELEEALNHIIRFIPDDFNNSSLN